MRIENCINLDDLRRVAKRRLPKIIYDFIEGGVDDEDGLTRNEEAFRQRALLPRYLVDVTSRDQSTEMFGRRYASAFGIGPTGGIGNYRRGGDLMLAAAVRDANIPFIMSGAATATMEEVARTAPEHAWFQLYSARDRTIVDDMIRRATELGLSTLVITIDVPVGSNRERNRRNGFGRPLRLSLATKLDALRRPRWFADYLRHGIAMMADWQRYAGDGANADEVGEFAAAQLRAPITWAELARIRERWPRKLVLKGILRTDDALRAAEMGVDGIIVSNHGARQLDRAPAALDVLPGIVGAVGERMCVMLDGGIRRGADVLIALSLGARFVFLGRPTLYGVVAGGQAGAALGRTRGGQRAGGTVSPRGVHAAVAAQWLGVAAPGSHLRPAVRQRLGDDGRVRRTPPRRAQAGELARVTPSEVDAMLDALISSEWVVYAKPCLNHTASVLAYLARYTHRIALSEQRLVGIDGARVGRR